MTLWRILLYALFLITGDGWERNRYDVSTFVRRKSTQNHNQRDAFQEGDLVSLKFDFLVRSSRKKTFPVESYSKKKIPLKKISLSHNDTTYTPITKSSSAWGDRGKWVGGRDRGGRSHYTKGFPLRGRCKGGGGKGLKPHYTIGFAS